MSILNMILSFVIPAQRIKEAGISLGLQGVEDKSREWQNVYNTSFADFFALWVLHLGESGKTGCPNPAQGTRKLWQGLNGDARI